MIILKSYQIIQLELIVISINIIGLILSQIKNLPRNIKPTVEGFPL